MNRYALGITGFALLALAAAVQARSHSPNEVLDSVKGVPIASRIPCDGSTNPRQELQLRTTFSPGGRERSFHIDVFRAKYCRRLDLYYICVFHGHDGWRPAWSRDNSHPPSTERFWLQSCSAWASGDAAQYLLSGWYKEEVAGGKSPWKQAAIRKVSSNPEVYEFTDPNGGTARLEIGRK